MMRHQLDRCGNCERVPRSLIKFADYNPRKPLTADKKRRLKKGLEKHGLCEPLVWNKRTGNLVGGHQRLYILDSLATEKEWDVPVSVQDLDDAAERELNILLNNQEAASEFDLGLLANMASSNIKIDFTSAGFDLPQITAFIPQIIADSMPEVQAAKQKSTEQWNKERDRAKSRENAAIDRVIDDPTTGPPRDKDEARVLSEDDHFWTTIVDRDFATAMKRREAWGFDPMEKFLDGRDIEIKEIATV